MSSVDDEALVHEYVRTRDAKLREQIIVRFLPVVKTIMGRMRFSVRNHAELEDIRSAGIIGLIQALEDFDASKNTKFKTYASLRIQGYILDYLRRIDFISRTDRAKVRQIEKTTLALTKRFGRPPSDSEVAAELNLDMSEYFRLLELVQINYTVAIDQPLEIDGEAVHLSEVLTDEDSESPLERFSRADLLHLVKETIRKLPERERLIVLMYYGDELTLMEIGKVLGLSESRVSRLLGKALITVRNHIQAVTAEGLAA